MADEWRRVVATLADPIRRRVYAEVVLGGNAGDDASIPARKREKAIAALLEAGLISRTPGGHEPRDAAFTELLALAPAVSREGVDRFIRNGRIEQFPARPGDRDAVLRWARDAAIHAGEEVSESLFTERLSLLAPDAVTLRRYLVDSGLVARDADGQRYRIAE